jgi:Cu2+-exporting ATPase
VALTRADSGLAIGAGTDVAVDAADIVLVKSSIRDVAAAIRMSRATIRNIHENLFWAFFYNALCIPLAMGLYGIALKPMYGAAAMACSSVFVCLNALRLNLVKVYNGDHDKAPKRFSDQSFRDKIKTVVNEMKTNIEPENIKPENIKPENVKPENSKPENIKGETIMEKTINIEGMMCPHCEATVKKALEALDGVDSAIVSHEKGTAVVSFSQEVADEVLTKAVEDKDYKVIAIK